MKIIRIANDKHEIILDSADVESAVRQFICTCHPEYATEWVGNPKYLDTEKMTSYEREDYYATIHHYTAQERAEMNPNAPDNVVNKDMDDEHISSIKIKTYIFSETKPSVKSGNIYLT